MQDWQIAVLNSRDIRVDQDQYTGYRLVIRTTDEKNRMRIPEVVAAIRNTRRKPVIMRPDDPFKGMYADRKEVLDVLMSTAEYEDYAMWMAEARMNGVIRWGTARSSPRRGTSRRIPDWASISTGTEDATASRDSWSTAD